MEEEVVEVRKKAEKNKKRSIVQPNEPWRRDTTLERAADESESKSESEEEEEYWFENWLD